MKIYEPVYGGQSGSYREGKVEEDSPPFIHKFTHSSGLKRGSSHIFKILNKMFHMQIHMRKDDSKTRMPTQMFSVHGWNSKSGVEGCGCANGQQRCVKCQLCDLSVEIVAPDTWKWNKETRANYCSLFVSHQLEVFLSQKQSERGVVITFVKVGIQPAEFPIVVTIPLDKRQNLIKILLVAFAVLG